VQSGASDRFFKELNTNIAAGTRATFDKQGGAGMDDTTEPHFMSRRAFVAAAGVASVGAAAITGEAAAAEPAASEAAAADRVAEGLVKSNFGACPDDEALEKAWDEFCQHLQKAGKQIFKTTNPPTPLMRADGFRFLTQNLCQAFALGFEVKDTKYPVIYTFCSPYFKLGGDNADCVYQQAWIDGESVYKISGNRGSVRFFNITVQGERPEMQPGTKKPSLMDPFGDIPEATIYGHELQTEWDGGFELYIGGSKRGPNWVPTTSHTRKLFIRQYFDRWDERPALLRIERVGMTTPRPVPTPQDMERAMQWAGRFMSRLTADFPDWTYAYSAGMDPVNVNKFPAARRPNQAADVAYGAATDKLRGRAAINMTWKLALDEAMIIEFDEPTGIFWMLTNMGVFMNSMDYLYRPISYTPARTKVDKDGKIRFVMSHDDPGYHNWIDTSGFAMGNITSRNILAPEVYTEYRTKLVKRSEVAAAMPADSVKVTPEQRTQLMLERFHAINRRYSL
jgi:hypothetical protein